MNNIAQRIIGVLLALTILKVWVNHDNQKTITEGLYGNKYKEYLTKNKEGV